ncbi:hypothetical protein M758_7G032700 [Ceratodon purpureus]|nr:hypothetical protein M758_7G032700 [Ceratodon purpureus]
MHKPLHDHQHSIRILLLVCSLGLQILQRHSRDSAAIVLELCFLKLQRNVHPKPTRSQHFKDFSDTNIASY